MDNSVDRRTEQRLRYHWPVWFAEDFDGVLSQGQMVDVSSGGAAFTCHADNYCPYPDQVITARFSIPKYDSEESFDISSFTRSGRICRVEKINNFVHRVAIQFAERLPFKPGEQEQQEQLQATAV